MEKETAHRTGAGYVAAPPIRDSPAPMLEERENKVLDEDDMLVSNGTLAVSHSGGAALRREQ
jgi:hypothetical protein